MFSIFDFQIPSEKMQFANLYSIIKNIFRKEYEPKEGGGVFANENKLNV